MKKSRILPFLISGALTLSALTMAYAAPTPSPTATASPKTEDKTISDKTAEGVYIENDSLKAPEITAQAGLLMDMKSGRVLYSKNAQEKLYPASTTKIMTAILALEMGNMEDVVTAGVAPLATITNEDSHMGILIGEQLTMEQLVNGMLVYSANDAANVIAYHISGSMDAFVDLMNKKAQELGAVNTHFANACGIHDDNHYTTAEDLSIIAKYAMQNEKFRSIVKQPTYHIPPTNKYTVDRNLSNTNLFLSRARSSYHVYSPATGIKTGHTSAAGYCLVSSAEYEGTELLSVVLKCNNKDDKDKAYSYIDSKALFEFGFNNYKYDVLAKANDIISEAPVYEAKANQHVNLTVTEDLSALLPAKVDLQNEIEKNIEIPDRIQAPLAQNQVVGKITYSIKGSVIASTSLVAANAVERNILLSIFHIVTTIVTSPFFYVPVILIIILLFIRKKRKKREERKNRLRKLKMRSSIQSEDKGRHSDAAKINAKYKQWDNKQNPNSLYKKK